MKNLMISRYLSIKYAFTGIKFNLQREPNFLIQLIFACMVIIAGIFFNVTKSEWIILVIAIGIVLSAEAMNTSIEHLCDRFLDREDRFVKIIKDSAAAAVLIITIATVVVGIIVFLPYVIEFIGEMWSKID